MIAAMARRPDDLHRPTGADSDERPAPVPRRKLGRIVRNERGGASMEWTTYTEQDSAERVVLQILETPADGDYSVVPAPGTPAPERNAGLQPYGTPVLAERERAEAPPRRPADLRKLSEWIKLTRKLSTAKPRKRWF
jgi:hypothetical protein